MSWHDYWLALALSGGIVVAAFVFVALLMIVIGHPS